MTSAFIRPSHIPLPTHEQTPRYVFTPYPAIFNYEYLHGLFKNLSMHSVTAIEYVCTSSWKLQQRRMDDDMLFCVIRGAGTIWIEGRKHDLKAGDCAHMPRGKPQAAVADSINPWTFISIHYTTRLFESLSLHEILQFPDVFTLKVEQIAMLKEACREYALRPLGWERTLEALVTTQLLRLMREAGTHCLKPFESGQIQDLWRLLPALELIRNQMREPLSVPDLSRKCNLSTAQFRRIFTRTMDVSPIQYIRRIRMEKACRLLRETQDTVEAISAKVGYMEVASFANSFRQLMGLSPGRYRHSKMASKSGRAPVYI